MDNTKGILYLNDIKICKLYDIEWVYNNEYITGGTNKIKLLAHQILNIYFNTDDYTIIKNIQENNLITILSNFWKIDIKITKQDLLDNFTDRGIKNIQLGQITKTFFTDKLKEGGENE